MQTSTAGTLNREAGFTLLELAIVVLLLGLFASMTVPLINHYGRDDLAWSARRIAGTVKYLFNEAAITGREHRLVLEPEKNRMTATIVQSNGEVIVLDQWEKRLILPETVTIKDVKITGKNLFSSGTATIHFMPTGFLEESLIHLTEDQKTVTLRLNPFTGSTEVQEGYHDF